MLSAMPVTAPANEFASTALSFPRGIRPCIMIICSIPIIIRSGDMICNGSMAPSYPGPASILIISGANMTIRTDTGMNMSSRRSNDFFNSLLNSSKRLSARIDDISLGKGTVLIQTEAVEGLFYNVLGETTGLDIKNDEELVSMLCALSEAKREYDKIKNDYNKSQSFFDSLSGSPTYSDYIKKEWERIRR